VEWNEGLRAYRLLHEISNSINRSRGDWRFHVTPRLTASSSHACIEFPAPASPRTTALSWLSNRQSETAPARLQFRLIRIQSGVSP
jgi:hypothetical protein